MNRLEKLMQELCPNGVEWKVLGEVCIKTSNIRWKESDKEYYYIDLSSVNVENHQIEEPRLINRQNAPSRAQQIILQNDILFGTTRPLLKRLCLIPSEYDNQICSTAFCILRVDVRQLLPQYLYFLLSIDTFYAYVEKNQEGAGYPAISDTKIFDYTIPVPPLPIQEEIVRILETYKKLQEELKTNLQNELEAYKTQYEYYRNHLFDLEGVEGVEWKKLGEVCNFIGGGTPDKNNKSYYGGNIRWATVSDMNGNFIEDTLYHITDDAIQKSSSKLIKSGSVIISTHVGVGKVCIIKYDTAINQDLKAVIPITDKINIDNKFLLYWFQSQKEFLLSNARGGTVKGIGLDFVKSMDFPVLPLPVQHRIVSILDRFDTLLNDLTAGIPAEIEAVTRQYEYYRDKLLTFKRP